MTTAAGAVDIGDLFRNSARNWGRWGQADELGSINFLDPEEVVRAAASVRSGKVFPLGLEMMRPGGDPTIGIRGQAKKFMSADKGFFANGQLSPMPGNQEWSDDAIFMYLQGSTHIDALGHVWYDDTLYNGYPASTTTGGLKKNSVKPIADHGVVGRGVLIDVPRARGVRALGDGEHVPLAELLAIAAAQQSTIEKHDILLVRTGRPILFEEGGNAAFVGSGQPGVTDEPEFIAFVHDMEIPMLGSDTITGEASLSPVSGARLPLHAALLTNLGVPFNELLWLEDLAADCAADGQYTFMYAASPLRIHGATGSPVNPLAIK